MRKWLTAGKLLMLNCLVVPLVFGQKVEKDSLNFSIFGKVRLFEQVKNLNPPLIYFTDINGWNKKEQFWVNKLCNMPVTLAVVDTRHMNQSLETRNNKCVYPAADLEELSKRIQKKLQRNNYEYPVLIGHYIGSSWILAIISQAPENTFAGGIALGFDEHLNTTKALCKGSGLYTNLNNNGSYILNSGKIMVPEPFYLYYNASMKNAENEVIAALTQNNKNITAVALKSADNDLLQSGNLMSYVKTAYEKINSKQDHFTAFHRTLNNTAVNINGLPLNFYPAGKNENLPLCIMLSGDGGWTGFDQNLALELSSSGIPVCGLNSLKYFWEKKTPAKVADDINAIAVQYLQKTGKQTLMLVGYSFGADVLPFIYNRLPADLKNITIFLTMLSPSKLADFEIHYSDMLGLMNTQDQYDVFHEIRTIQNTKLLLIYGSDEESDEFHPYYQNNVRIITLEGGHHYNNSFDKIKSEIIKSLTSQL